MSNMQQKKQAISAFKEKATAFMLREPTGNTVKYIDSLRLTIEAAINSFVRATNNCPLNCRILELHSSKSDTIRLDIEVSGKKEGNDYSVKYACIWKDVRFKRDIIEAKSTENVTIVIVSRGVTFNLKNDILLNASYPFYARS